MLQAKPATLVERVGGWYVYDQAVRDGPRSPASAWSVAADLVRAPTGVEHGLRQDEEERARRPTGQDAGEPAPERRSWSRCDAVDRLVSGRLRFTGASGRIVRAAACRHQVADPRTIERALFVTGSPKRDQLLGAAGWDHEGPPAPRPAGSCSRATRAPGAGPSAARGPDGRSTLTAAAGCRPSPSGTRRLPRKVPAHAMSPENSGAAQHPSYRTRAGTRRARAAGNPGTSCE